MNSPILAPAAVLIAWSLLVLLWMVSTRLPALSKAGIDLRKAEPGGRGSDLESSLPSSVNWKAHNFTHLMEQPTLFYAVVGVLALAGAGDGLNAQVAWAYVGFRVAHSLWQGLVNTIPVRFGLFALSNLCLIVLSVRALMATLG